MDSLNVNFDKEGFRLEGIFTNRKKQQKVVCINRGVGKKELFLNDVQYDKFSKHIGVLPVVMIAPDDIDLITGKSENRRRYIDTLISQVDAGYLLELINYNKVLQQRNSLLKKMQDEGPDQMLVLEILDQQLIAPGVFIHKKRTAFLQELIPLVERFYHKIAGNVESISLNYISQLNEFSFDELIKQSRYKDMMLQRSTAGIHKDDISFSLDAHIFKNIASQGQRKSLLFALKLAEFELLKQHKGFSPILLLDDVFEKLDNNRMQQLLLWVCRENKGQVFITDTHRNRLEQAFDSLDVPFQIIEL